MKTLVLAPAYGRDYKSKAAVLAAWETGKDFKMCNFDLSGYVNNSVRPLLLETGYTTIEFRYCRLTKCFIHPLESSS